ncbi:MAG: RagB/SusD family nutrient uptake outer membrane protein [Bacteroidales bacterium]|nr:RagB/SusD family nutrient uptake outer membrane protein [Bacteroidales bacterium]
MKRYKSLLYFAAGLAMAACTEIEEYPDGRLSFDQIFQNQKLTGAYMNNCYEGLNLGHGHIYGSHSFIEGATDNAADVDDANGGSISLWNQGAVTSFTNPLGTPKQWNLYTYIRQVNTMLHYLPDAEIHTESVREHYRGECYALRAYYYLQLLKTYGAVPLMLDNYDTEVSSDNTYDYSTVQVTTPCDIARQVIADAREAIACEQLEWHSGSSDNDAFRMSKAIAAATMSEAALFAASPLNNDGTFSWQDAAEVCLEALTGCTTNGYSLYNTAPTLEGLLQAYNVYDFYFLGGYDVRGASDPETIMGYNGQYSIWQYHGLPTTTGQTSAGTCPSQELIDCYETIDGVAPILGYADADHLQPIINPVATLYDPANPYANRDPRLMACVYYNGAPLSPQSETLVSTADGGNCAISSTNVRNTRTGYYLRKFGSPLSDRSLNSDGAIKAFRLAELYLNYAECVLEASTSETAPREAVNAVNKIRDRVGMPRLGYDMSRDEFRKRLRNERRVELAFEDNYFYDLRRWKALSGTETVTGMRPLAEGGYQRFVVSRSKATADKYLRFPIPGEEAVRLKQATGHDWQNAGW